MRIWLLAAGALVSCSEQPPASPVDTARVGVEVERVRAIDALDRECAGPDCAAGSSKPVLASSSPPVGAAGFDLGTLDTEAERRCRAAGELWAAGGSAARPSASCSGSAGAPLPFKVDLRLCDGNVCRIVLSQQVGDIASALDRFRSVDADLAGKYGPASARDLAIPDDCGARALPACLERGRARVRSSWVWDAGYSALATLAAPAGGAIFLIVAYGSPAFAKAARASGL